MENNEIVVSKFNSEQDIFKIRNYDLTRSRYKYVQELMIGLDGGYKLNLFDIGGGAGEMTEFARKLRFNTTLIDGNINNVNTEIQKGQQAFFADFNKVLPFSSSQADVIVCLEVIEHVVPAEQLISEMFRLLKPGGRLFLSTPNFSYYRDRISYLLGKNVKAEGYHYRFFTYKYLNKILLEQGFEIVKRNSYGGILGIAFLFKIISLGRIKINNLLKINQLFEPFFAHTFVIELKKIK
jgi:ubiquinone/menaquinone biosynthesis C-methylase UbiE